MVGFRLLLNHFERIATLKGEVTNELCFTEWANYMDSSHGDMVSHKTRCFKFNEVILLTHSK